MKKYLLISLMFLGSLVSINNVSAEEKIIPEDTNIVISSPLNDSKVMDKIEIIADVSQLLSVDENISKLSFEFWQANNPIDTKNPISPTLIGEGKCLEKTCSIVWDTTLISNGVYSIWINALDLQSNIDEIDNNIKYTSSSVFVTVDNIISDTKAPIIKIIGSNPMEMKVGSIYKEEGATAIDEIDGLVEVIISGSVDTAKIGSYAITYTAIDKAGNKAEASRLVNISELSIVPDPDNDITPPEISETKAFITPTNDATPSYTFKTNEAGVINIGGACSISSSSDNDSSFIQKLTSVLDEIIGIKKNAIVGENTITFDRLSDGKYSDCTVSVTDSSKNESNVLKLDVFVIDTIAPTITINDYTTSPVNTDLNIIATVEGGTLNYSSYLFTENGSFEFIAKDEAGNQASKIITISNIDKVAPVITINPYITSQTNEDVTVTATTNEGALNTETHTFTENGKFTFVATDIAGNSTSEEVTISNIDKTQATSRRHSSSGSYIPRQVVVAPVVVIPVVGQVLGAEKFIFTKLLKNGSIDNEVLELQKFLNANNFVIALTGPGSVGNETTKFGSLTRQAVIKFQISRGLVGDGQVGAKTRAELNK